ncbi:caspase domain-containing protein [Vararia minispora EC-137]|uniref:Caspase domain-containing protein n=1 Tax=Vararia minispora EC-137 TaxID=1314806 RepID=A0ACB8QFH5_9AGAM|nr:caspase domain-containing protein [Vararia minispora EC-137]
MSNNFPSLFPAYSSRRKEPVSPNGVIAVHALLIGIDRYSSDEFPKLGGAVSDMQRVKDFLVDDLSVPESCVKVLKNEGATRQAIIQAFQELASSDNNIRKGDPILIYFAGHGSTVTAPPNWTSDPEIQVLIPYDGHSDGEVATNVIPDRKFGSLLRDLANAKGDNITVILDCCHSTSGTRSTDSPQFDDDKGFFPRGVELKRANNPKADVALAPVYRDEVQRKPEDGEGSRGIVTSGKFLNASMRSHVLLAACGENQSAFEKHGSGLFTTALLMHFKTRGIGSHTYAEIIVALGGLAKGRQTPQCEGAHRHTRRLFNSRVHFRGHPPRSIRFSSADDAYIISNAGQVHGVMPGTEFAVYASPASLMNPEPLCYLVVDEVGVTSSTLRPRISDSTRPPLLPSTAVALQFQAARPIGDLRVHVPDEEQLQFVCYAIERSRQGGGTLWSIERSDEGHATIGVALEEGNVAFIILDKDIRALGLTRLRFTVPPTVDHVADALRAAAHYFFHVNRTPEKPLLRHQVMMHVYKLEETDDLDEDLRRILLPFRPQVELVRMHSDPARALMGVYDPWAVIADDAKTYYGVELQSQAEGGLFLSMFYFDSGTLEIRQLYSSSTAAPDASNLDPPLRPVSSLSLNYGNGGGEPLRFVIDEGQDMDLGILRVFVSSQPFDLDIEQKAFETSRPNQDVRALPTATAGLGSKAPPRMDSWDVITLPIVQTRPIRENDPS